MPDISDSEIEQGLTNAWHFQREAVFRWERKVIWSTVDSYLTVLDDSTVSPGQYIRRDLFNKPTAVYFEQSAQFGCYNEERGYPCISRIDMAATYEAWRARCGDEFDMEYGHYLANPVRITKRGPKSLSEIVEAHQALCNIAKERGLEDDNYRIQASYPSVIIVFDHEKKLGRDEDGRINLRKVAEQSSVLVMRTGSSSGIEVSLDDLDPHALPLERADAENMDVRRVPLAVAVDFIVSLEARTKDNRIHKYDDKLCRHDFPKGVDRAVRIHPQTWVAALMAERTKVGSEMPHDVSEAIQRIEARNAGVPCDWDFEHMDWQSNLKSGHDS